MIDAAKDGRCTGHCCRDFQLQEFPGDLLRNFETALDGVGADGDRLIADIETIAPMVIPLGPDLKAKGYWRYTCRHLLQNGDCAIYARRPRMCSAFPYDVACPHTACTLSSPSAGV